MQNNDHQGLRPPTGSRVNPTTHASAGIGKAYPQEVRDMIIQRYLNGFQDNDEIATLRMQKKYPSRNTVLRWIAQYNEKHHALPYKRTGNHRAERELHGVELVELALFRCIKPKPTIVEVKAYLYNRHPDPDNFTPYSDSQMHRAEDRLCLTRKAASTTAYQALTPVNRLKRHNYWNLPYPYGVADIATDDLIDIDECGVYLEVTNRGYGKTYIGQRADEAGIYNRVGEKLNLLLAVSADPNDPRRWSMMWIGGGTTIERYEEFMNVILDDLNQSHPGRSYCFTKDNLIAHKSPLITGMIFNADHRLVFRAPYYAVDGAIEYVFNTIQTMLQMFYHQVDTMEHLEQKIIEIIASIDSFRSYFVHVGFR
jgi:hypothetical protein